MQPRQPLHAPPPSAHPKKHARHPSAMHAQPPVLPAWPQAYRQRCCPLHHQHQTTPLRPHSPRWMPWPQTPHQPQLLQPQPPMTPQPSVPPSSVAGPVHPSQPPPQPVHSSPQLDASQKQTSDRCHEPPGQQPEQQPVTQMPQTPHDRPQASHQQLLVSPQAEQSVQPPQTRSAQTSCVLHSQPPMRPPVPQGQAG